MYLLLVYLPYIMIATCSSELAISVFAIYNDPLAAVNFLLVYLPYIILATCSSVLAISVFAIYNDSHMQQCTCY